MLYEIPKLQFLLQCPLLARLKSYDKATIHHYSQSQQGKESLFAYFPGHEKLHVSKWG